jgi:hypothetical protein
MQPSRRSRLVGRAGLSRSVILRAAALVILVAAVAALSRLNGHANAVAAAEPPPPLPSAATVVKRGMTKAQVRRLAGRPEVVHGVRVPCVIYATDEPIQRRMETIVCFDRHGRVSTIHTGLQVHSRPPDS